MGIRLVISDTTPVRVKGEMPTKTGRKDFDFTLHMKLRPGDEVEAEGRQARASLDDDSFPAWAREFCLPLIEDWSGVGDQDGHPVPFSPDAGRMLLNILPGMAPLVFAEYIKNCSVRGKEKN